MYAPEVLDPAVGIERAEGRVACTDEWLETVHDQLQDAVDRELPGNPTT